MKRTDLSVYRERAVLVAVVPPGRDHQDTDPFEELRSLAWTAGAEVVEYVAQRRDRPEPATYIGRGKTEELASLARAVKADVIIFNNDLSPSQIRNLEQTTDTKVLDRSELILDIFATRARTYEAKLQVELAQLEYALPRLRRMWTHLSRIEGGIGTRGPGEQQLEVDRRAVEHRIHDLKRQIREVEKRRQREVASRGEELTVSLVGYTNAGKSSLMNALTGSHFLVEDKLFATLDTRTRRWPIGRQTVLLSDTVGFIRDLPHHLVASFRATLEEARQADVLLHVVDASHPRAIEQAATVGQVLAELDCQDKPTVVVLNKIDRVGDQSLVDVLRSRHEHTVLTSAVTGLGLDQLARQVGALAEQTYVETEIELPAGDGQSQAFLCRHGVVLGRHYEADRVRFRVRLSRKHLGQFHSVGRRLDSGRP